MSRSNIAARVRMTRRYSVVLLAAGVLFAGCSSSREMTKTPRGAIEQLLLSQSLERSLSELSVPVLNGVSVFIQADGLTPDLSIVTSMIRDRLALQHVQFRDRAENAQFLIKVIVHSIGTEQSETLVGLPASQGALIPIAFPELALYKSSRQKGYVRFSMDIFEAATGRLVQALPWRAGAAHYNFFTVFFLITFTATDLILPPTPDVEPEELLELPKDPSSSEEREPEHFQVSPGPL
ncbi:MAG: hypothetical protein ACRDGM_08585 [bacterium]